MLNPWKVAPLVPVVLGPIWVTVGAVACVRDHVSANLLTFAASVLVVAALAAAIDDTRRRKIANWITYPAFGWLFAVSIACSPAPESMTWLGTVPFVDMLLGSLCCFVIVLLPYLFGVGGGGDAKIAAVIGAGLGLKYGLIAVGSAFVIAAMAAILRDTLRRGPVFVVRAIYRRLSSWMSQWFLPPSRDDQGFLNQPLPMGASFFCGVVLTMTDVIPKLIL